MIKLHWIATCFHPTRPCWLSGILGVPHCKAMRTLQPEKNWGPWSNIPRGQNSTNNHMSSKTDLSAIKPLRETSAHTWSRYRTQDCSKLRTLWLLPYRNKVCLSCWLCSLLQWVRWLRHRPSQKVYNTKWMAISSFGSPNSCKWTELSTWRA